MFDIITATSHLTIVTFPFGGITSNPIKHPCRYFATQTTQYVANLAFTK